MIPSLSSPHAFPLCYPLSLLLPFRSIVMPCCHAQQTDGEISKAVRFADNEVKPKGIPFILLSATFESTHTSQRHSKSPIPTPRHCVPSTHQTFSTLLTHPPSALLVPPSLLCCPSLHLTLDWKKGFTFGASCGGDSQLCFPVVALK